ncbi:MAG: NADH-quinone oxidoreductase subunit NuoG [Actinobacteria bacterium]|nr:NADH-quinone oxidoreductase subunit NuoG [Actinomycetota bacterium]
MPTIYIDNEAFEVPEGQNLLAACLALGFDIPYFCWHPGMGSVGACRQCAIKKFKDEHDSKGEIVMACLTPADEGVRISIDDPEARAFRAAVAEWLMASHPHDCPVCDEGGECHLQDMTVMAGHAHRRYRFTKRTFPNQDLGPFVNHEMNRCIQCYRCVRFYSDYAGGDDLVAMGTRNQVYFGSHKDGKLDSEFSGNLVEVCPTGVFTDKTFRRHYTRKWDLQTAPSVCVHCGLGCNVFPGERYGRLRCIRNRYNADVNGYFLCDRGRFGYEFVNADTRLREADPPDAVAAMIEIIIGARKNGGRVIGIGSPRASLESNFALRKLVGRDSFFVGTAGHEQRLIDTAWLMLKEGPSRSPSLRDLEQADAMLVLGEDVTNTAPMLDYSLRQWLRRRPNPERLGLGIPEWNDAALGEIFHEVPSHLHIATVYETKLDKIAAQTYHAAPHDLARLGFAVAHLIDSRAPAVNDLPKDIEDHARSIAGAFETAARPIVVSGVSCGSQQVMRAAANVAWSLHARAGAAELCFVVPECNSLGMALIGGRPLEEAFAEAADPGIELAIIIENDLYRRAAKESMDRFLRLCRHVVTIDHTVHATARASEMRLPAATYVESTGTLVSNEGRAQRYYRAMAPQGEARASWEWLRDVSEAAGGWNAQDPEGSAGRRHRVAGQSESEQDGRVADPSGAERDQAFIDLLAAEMSKDIPFFAPLPEVAPPASSRVKGMRIPRESPRFSGRTAIYADKTVFEPKPPVDSESPLADSMEGFEGEAPAPLIPRYWSPGWNSPQAVIRFQTRAGGSLRGGNIGIRLIEPARVGKVSHFLEVPPAFAVRPEGVLVVPSHHIFGSEELSVLSPGVAGCAPEPYLGVGLDTVNSLVVGEGDPVLLKAEDFELILPVKIMPSLPDGVVALPVGLPGLNGMFPPLSAQVTRAPEAEPPNPEQRPKRTDGHV